MTRREVWQGAVLDELGNIIQERKLIESETFDDRTPQDARDEKLQELRSLCSQAIEAEVPEFKQRNIGMGVYDEAKTKELAAQVKAHKDRFDALEALVNAEEDLMKIDAISWHTTSV